MTVGKRIKRLRYERDMKQSTLGEMLGVSQAAISSWERGIAQPDYKMLFKIASVLGTTPMDLLGRTPPSPIPSVFALRVRFVPVVRDVNQDISADNIITLTPFPDEGVHQVFGYELQEDYGSYIAGDVVFVSKREAYRGADQVVLVEKGKINITEFKRRNEDATLVGAIVGFCRTRNANN